jgi:hypothetical protein
MAQTSTIDMTLSKPEAYTLTAFDGIQYSAEDITSNIENE